MFSFVVREAQLTFICDFRAMPSLVPPCVVPWSENHPSVPPCPVPGLGTTLLLSFCCPSHTLFCGPRDPMFSLVVRAAAANVNPRTRLSHLTPFSGRDWCTRERCRLMMQIPPRILRRARDSLRTFPGFSEKVRRRPGLDHTHSPTPPLKPGACSTEAPLKPSAWPTGAWCVFHWRLPRGINPGE
jgi:hypothetical protein